MNPVESSVEITPQQALEVVIKDLDRRIDALAKDYLDFRDGNQTRKDTIESPLNQRGERKDLDSPQKARKASDLNTSDEQEKFHAEIRRLETYRATLVEMLAKN